MKRTRCKRCEAFIVWARREGSDRFVPMNADSDPKGTHVLMGWDDPPVACVVDGALRDIRERHTVHKCAHPARAS